MRLKGARDRQRGDPRLSHSGLGFKSRSATAWLKTGCGQRGGEWYPAGCWVPSGSRPAQDQHMLLPARRLCGECRWACASPWHQCPPDRPPRGRCPGAASVASRPLSLCVPVPRRSGSLLCQQRLLQRTHWGGAPWTGLRAGRPSTQSPQSLRFCPPPSRVSLHLRGQQRRAAQAPGPPGPRPRAPASLHAGGSWARSHRLVPTWLTGWGGLRAPPPTRPRPRPSPQRHCSTGNQSSLLGQGQPTRGREWLGGVGRVRGGTFPSSPQCPGQAKAGGKDHGASAQDRNGCHAGPARRGPECLPDGEDRERIGRKEREAKPPAAKGAPRRAPGAWAHPVLMSGPRPDPHSHWDHSQGLRPVPSPENVVTAFPPGLSRG